jgi:large subunit ribosomal protein L21
MYAVIETGGKQYRVEVGTELDVELLDAAPGAAITFERVLLVADGDDASIGQPVVANAAVEAQVVSRERGEKLINFKYGPKTRRRVKKGHRQELTRLRITDVRLGDKSAASSAKKAVEDAKTERQRLEEAAAKQAAEDAALAAKLAARTDATAAAAPKKATKAAEAATEEAAPEPKKPARKTKASAAAAEGGDAETPETDVTKKPARKTKASAAAAEGGDAEATADATAADDKPKRTRAPKKDA